MDDQSGFENAVRADDRLRRARQAYAERAWREAYEAFSFAEEESPLTAEDLELLATSAYMLGREDEWLRGLERAHHLYADAGEIPRAVRCAFWVGTGLAHLVEGEPPDYYAALERPSLVGAAAAPEQASGT